jgi:hypothetical protein
MDWITFAGYLALGLVLAFLFWFLYCLRDGRG